MLEQMSSSVDRLTDVAGKQTHHIENLWEEIGQKQNRINALVNKVNDIFPRMKAENILRTFSFFTAKSISINIKNFLNIN